MIYIKEGTNTKAYEQAFASLWGSGISSDEELLRERPACVEILEFMDESTVSLDVKKRTLIYEYDWKETFRHIDEALILEEIRYWNSEFFGEDKRFDEIVNYLRYNTLSKRAIVQFWKDEYKDLSGPAACLAAVFFRVDGDKLHIHTHARASNASFLFFMDLQVMRAFQNAVAHQIGKEAGDFVFFSDSLHLYRSEEESIQELAKRIMK
jgi:thymidylate synthase